MPGALHKYLSDDHKRLDGLLQTATANPAVMDLQPYAEFRKGLLRHIAIEEKILFPAIAGSEHTALTARLRLDHGALVALLVPPPSRSIVATIQTILRGHNPVEEGEGGLYEIFERVGRPDTGTMLKRMESAPEVTVLPHNERPGALEATRRAVARAGYEWKGEL
jgi:hypothetical protein